MACTLSIVSMSESSSIRPLLYVNGIVAVATGKKVAVAVWITGSVLFGIAFCCWKLIGLLGRFLLGAVRFVSTVSFFSCFSRDSNLQ